MHVGLIKVRGLIDGDGPALEIQLRIVERSGWNDPGLSGLDCLPGDYDLGIRPERFCDKVGERWCGFQRQRQRLLRSARRDR